VDEGLVLRGRAAPLQMSRRPPRFKRTAPLPAHSIDPPHRSLQAACCSSLSTQLGARIKGCTRNDALTRQSLPSSINPTPSLHSQQQENDAITSLSSSLRQKDAALPWESTPIHTRKLLGTCTGRRALPRFNCRRCPWLEHLFNQPNSSSSRWPPPSGSPVPSAPPLWGR